VQYQRPAKGKAVFAKGIRLNGENQIPAGRLPYQTALIFPGEAIFLA
jgi:hypothetical protein